MKMWEVDYNFIINKYGKKVYTENQMGFKTEQEATIWAKENTADGEVSWYKKI